MKTHPVLFSSLSQESKGLSLRIKSSLDESCLLFEDCLLRLVDGLFHVDGRHVVDCTLPTGQGRVGGGAAHESGQGDVLLINLTNLETKLCFFH
jgi:hypothetical protein